MKATSPRGSFFQRGLLAGVILVAVTVGTVLRAADSVYVFSTLAGSSGVAGSTDGAGGAARFDGPHGLALDTAGNLYIGDYNSGTIRKVTPTGVVTTVAGLAGATGSTDGMANVARFNHPRGLAVDAAGNLFVADMWNSTIRKVTPAGQVTTLAGQAGATGSADGAGSVARFNFPRSVAVDTAGNLFVADTDNHIIRKITATGFVTTLAGAAGSTGSADGTGIAARFSYPTYVSLDGAGNLLVADEQNHTIRQVTLAGVVSTVAGKAGVANTEDGLISNAGFSYPSCIVLGPTGEYFVAEACSTIRKISTGKVSTIGGAGWQTGTADGVGSMARFSSPQGIALDSAGNLYVADTNNHSIRLGVPTQLPTIVTQPTPITVLNAGQLLTLAVELDAPTGATYQWYRNGVALDGATNPIYTVTAVARADGGSYTVGATKVGVTAMSQVAIVAIGAGGQPGIKDSVAPLLTVEYPVFTWPLNAKFPLTVPDDNEAVNGRVGNACGPDGVANILRYWQHPYWGSGTRTFTDRLNCVWSFDFAGTALNYYAMPAAISVSSPADQIDAVATLMYAAGVAMHNVWRTGGGEDVAIGFRQYLHYSKYSQRAARADYTDAQWAALYQSELSAGRPILMSGNMVVGGGHWFICDGYNASGLYHIRWDYGEAHNQWLPLNGFEPYTQDQFAFIGLEPAVDAPPVFATQPQNQTVSVGGAAALTVAATTPDSSIAPTLHWQLSTDSGGSWTTLANGGPYAGVTASTLTVTGAAIAMNGHRFRVAVGNNKIPTGYSEVATLTVTKPVPAITWSAPAAINYGTALSTAQLNATSGGVAGTFAYSPAAGTVLTAGAQTLSVSFTPADTATYAPASATQSLNVNKALLTVRADDKSKPLGAANPVLTISYTGFLHGDTVTAITAPTISTTATTASASGFYPISLTGGSAANYNLTLINGTLAVAVKIVPTVTWSAPAAIIYGTALSPAQLNAAAGGTAGTFDYSPAVGTTLLAGPQTLGVTFTPADTATYATTSATQSLTVNKAPLTVRADDKNKVPGEPNPPLTISYIGFVNADTAASITPPLISTTATADSAIGSYPITLTGGNAANYLLTLQNGTLNVGPRAYLANLSVRAAMAAGQTLIVGFVVDGGAKPVLVRAAGPTLNNYGLTGVGDPCLTLYNGGTAVDQNDNWNAALSTIFATLGAFPFNSASKDAALHCAINGPHTAQATATGGGTILVEAYDAGANDGRKLVNLSTRFQVGTGDSILIAGFVLSGTGTKQLLIRAVGPTLASYGVTGTLVDPQLAVYDGGTVIASNDNWSSSLTPTFDLVGAFHLLDASKDAAIVVTLQAGKAYTVQVSGVGATTGEALIEIYAIP